MAAVPAAPTLVTVSPLGDTPLHFRSMTGSEEMSRPFEYVVDVLSKRPDLDLSLALGHPLTVAVQCSTGQCSTGPGTEPAAPRFFNGVISRFSQQGMYGNYHAYRAVLHPWLWFLNRFSDCRIFQNKSVPAIVNDILGKYPKIFGQYRISAALADELERRDRYPPREYTVQYRETDLNFVSRLLEEEGISYHFEHGLTSHKMVLTDSSQGRSPRAGYAAVSLRPGLGTGEIECLTSWHVSQELKTASYMLRDFDYLNPLQPVGVKRAATAAPGGRDARASNRQVVGELYDYPGGFATQGQGDHVVTTRLNEAQSFYEVVHASGNTRGPGVGNTFAVSDAPFSEPGLSHLVVGARYDLRGHDPESGGLDPGNDSFHCALTLVRSTEPFRPARQTPRPVVQGPQTAVVVGPRKDPDHQAEIWTDDLGRVLVRFHWERLGPDKPDDPSRAHDEDANDDRGQACWVRVASLWAGKQWGVQFTPRVGHEVMVEFLDGDPDRPIVTGRVYNNLNRPPYPNAKHTHSGIRTHSVPGGGAENFNEIRFEDKKGSEELFVQAEKRHTVVVKADRTLTVGGGETTDIKKLRTATVHEDDKLTIEGAHEMTVGKTCRLRSAGKFTLEQGGADSQNTITAERDTIAINAPAHLELSSEVEITLHVGASSITLKKDRIELKAAAVEITAETETAIAGGPASARLHGAIDLSGTTINMNV